MTSVSTIARYCVLLLLTLAMLAKSEAASLTASSIVTCKSFELGESTSSAGYKIYFNAYDGVTTYSRSQAVHNGEVLSYNSGGYTYIADYDIYTTGRGPFDGNYSPVGYGTISFAIPTTDSDGDGLIDFMDRSKAFNSTITGTITEFITSRGTRTYSTSCVFNRGANTEVGQFTFTTSAAQITGFFFLHYGTATVTYDPDARTIKFTGTSFGYGSPFSSQSFGTATSSYEILSPTLIKVNAFTYSNPYTTLNINSFTMTRTGNKFIATGSMVDGFTYSNWADYKDFVLAITDNNDVDGDGIPDLADNLIFSGPTITVEPESKTVIQGANTNLSVTASSPYAMTYQWYLNDELLNGKTDSTLTFTSIQPAAAGNYKVVITSNGKTKTSAVAALTVQVPPSITVTPTGTTIVAGRTLTLTAGASGTPAPTFEWYRGSDLIPGVTGATLTINGITLAQAGNYTAKAINPAGNATTTAAKVVVTTGIFSAPTGVTAASIQSSGFPLDLQLENGKSYRLQYSTDLVTWTTLSTFTSNGTTRQYLDAAASVNSQRFYRLISP